MPAWTVSREMDSCTSLLSHHTTAHLVDDAQWYWVLVLYTASGLLGRACSLHSNLLRPPTPNVSRLQLCPVSFSFYYIMNRLVNRMAILAQDSLCYTHCGASEIRKRELGGLFNDRVILICPTANLATWRVKYCCTVAPCK